MFRFSGNGAVIFNPHAATLRLAGIKKGRNVEQGCPLWGCVCTVRLVSINISLNDERDWCLNISGFG